MKLRGGEGVDNQITCTLFCLRLLFSHLFEVVIASHRRQSPPAVELVVMAGPCGGSKQKRICVNGNVFFPCVFFNTSSMG